MKDFFKFESKYIQATKCKMYDPTTIKANKVARHSLVFTRIYSINESSTFYIFVVLSHLIFSFSDITKA